MTAQFREEMRVAVRASARLHDVAAVAILRGERGRTVDGARQVAMCALVISGWSLSDTGRAFGRHHTTVMYARESAYEKVPGCVQAVIGAVLGVRSARTPEGST